MAARILVGGKDVAGAFNVKLRRRVLVTKRVLSLFWNMCYNSRLISRLCMAARMLVASFFEFLLQQPRLALPTKDLFPVLQLAFFGCELRCSYSELRVSGC
jgi:hypothetical protein